MHNYYSKVELVGTVLKVTHLKGLSKIRLMYRDQSSPSKFVSVYAWKEQKELLERLNLQNGDTVSVKGELAFFEHSEGDRHGIRLDEIKLLTTSLPAKRMDY